MIGNLLDNPAPSDLVLPLDAFKMSPAEALVFMSASDNLIQRCMADKGFDVPAIERVPLVESGNERRYGLTDLDSASRYGYQPPTLTDAERRAEVSLRRAEASVTSPEAAVAMDGGTFTNVDGPERVGGCLGWAQAQLDATEWAIEDRFVENIAGDAFAKAEADERVRAAFEAWSDCMAAKGYDYPDPWVANDDQRWAPPEGLESGPLTDGDPQLATAVADVTCKQEVNLVGISLAVESAYQLEMIEDNQERLREIQLHRDEILEAAAQVQ